MHSFHEELKLTPTFSYQFLILLITFYSGGGLLLIPLSFPLPVWSSFTLKISVVLLIGATAFRTIRYHLYFIDHPLYNCIVTHRATVLLTSGQRGELIEDCFSHPLLAILRVKRKDGKINVLVIFSDALEPDVFRILCVHLRHAKLARNYRNTL